MSADSLQRYVQHGDPDAFRDMVAQYQDLVYGTCRRILGEGAEVEDAVQETFIKLAKKAREIRSNPGAWLHACARTTALNVLKAQRSSRRREIQLMPDHRSAAGAAAAEACERADEASVVDACLDELSEVDREVVISYFFVDKSQEEIAHRIGVSQGSIQRRLERALEILRRKFVRRGLAVSGLMTAYFSELSAASRVPSTLAHQLATLDLSAAAQHSAPLAAQIVGKTAALKLGALVVAGVVAVGGGFALARHSPSPAPTVASPPFHVGWNFADPGVGARDFTLLAGDWRAMPSDGALAGGMQSPVDGPNKGWCSFRLPGEFPQQRLKATIRFHFAPDVSTENGLNLGWCAPDGSSGRHMFWRNDGPKPDLGSGSSYTCDFYLLRPRYVVVANDSTFINLNEYDAAQTSDRLYFRFCGFVIESIDIREVAEDEIPPPYRDPAALLEDMKRRLPRP